MLEFLPQPERLQASHDFQSNTTYDLDNDGEPDISFRTGDILLVEANDLRIGACGAIGAA